MARIAARLARSAATSRCKDVTKNASAMVMTTRLNDSLADCGVWGYCAFGYQYHWRDLSTCECQLLDDPAVTVTQVVSAAGSSSVTVSQNVLASSSIIIAATSNTTLSSTSAVTLPIDPSSSAASTSLSASEAVGAATTTFSIANDTPKEQGPLPKGAVAGISVACTGIGLGGAILILIFCHRYWSSHRRSQVLGDDIVLEKACRKKIQVPQTDEMKSGDQAHLQELDEKLFWEAGEQKRQCETIVAHVQGHEDICGSKAISVREM